MALQEMFDKVLAYVRTSTKNENWAPVLRARTRGGRVMCAETAQELISKAFRVLASTEHWKQAEAVKRYFALVGRRLELLECQGLYSVKFEQTQEERIFELYQTSGIPYIEFEKAIERNRTKKAWQHRVYSMLARVQSTDSILY